MSAIACGCWSPQERFHDLPATSVWENPSRSQQSCAQSISLSIATEALHSFQSDRQWWNGTSRQLVRHSDMYGIGVTQTGDRGFRPDAPNLDRRSSLIHFACRSARAAHPRSDAVSCVECVSSNYAPEQKPLPAPLSKIAGPTGPRQQEEHLMFFLMELSSQASSPR
jgi:hypothetical protein